METLNLDEMNVKGYKVICVTMVDASLSDIVSNTRQLSQAWYAHHDSGLTESVRVNSNLFQSYCALSIITSN